MLNSQDVYGTVYLRYLVIRHGLSSLCSGWLLMGVVVTIGETRILLEWGPNMSMTAKDLVFVPGQKM
ncbi:hypothetical protein B0T21DRAFT_375766 [Apiosordaria backusii]|uniref:Uncharacterized protein n=1 Tax=Apiosordaria backusii TaxID=314023 RepID=A0AA40AEH3_9PEZI|nr:hypothetical protein B0T21DRAFT_375766 [Apiosordaria backusii]